jgi:hypothetical protein
MAEEEESRIGTSAEDNIEQDSLEVCSECVDKIPC